MRASAPMKDDADLGRGRGHHVVLRRASTGYSTLATNTTRNAIIDIHADGTCTYMIFCRCPCRGPAPTSCSAAACAAMKNSTANQPNGSSQRGRSGTVRVPDIGRVHISILDHMLEGEQCAHEEDHVEYHQQPDPCPALAHEVAGQDGARRLDGATSSGISIGNSSSGSSTSRARSRLAMAA
jgi:hypothetical protein